MALCRHSSDLGPHPPTYPTGRARRPARGRGAKRAGPALGDWWRNLQSGHGVQGAPSKLGCKRPTPFYACITPLLFRPFGAQMLIQSRGGSCLEPGEEWGQGDT